MDARGNVKSDDPDLLINFNAILQVKTTARASSAPLYGGYGGFYGYRSDFYDPWAGYGFGTEAHVSN